MGENSLKVPLAFRSMAFVLGLLLSLALLGCSDDGGGMGDGDAGINEIGPLFDPDRVLEIVVDLSESDWDLIRHQKRTLGEVLSGDCLDAPFPSPFTYVQGTITIDGVMIDDVGVRKKGFIGSLDDEKPSLKIKFDKYVAGREVQGYERLTLNNCKQDPSLIKQCLGYEIFREAGVPSPLCNFAHVTVNGEDLGIFANVESVKKQFLRRYYDDSGNLYEGTLSDFREGWTGTFEKKTNKDVAGPDDIGPVVTALESDDSMLVAALDPLVNLDSYYSFWATEILIGHWDGYAGNNNNFFIYVDPADGKIDFFPWGIDGILAEGQGETTFQSVFANGFLARRLYLHPETQQSYLTELTGLLDTVWDETFLMARVDQMEALIDPFVGFATASYIEDVRDFISGRRSVIEAELTDGPPVWDDPPKDVICFEEIGDASLSFSTTFGTLENGDPFSEGTGSLSGDLQSVPFDPLLVGSVAGFDPESPDEDMAIIMVPAYVSDLLIYIFYIAIPAEYLEDGAAVDVDWVETNVLLFQLNPTTEENEMIGAISQGTVEFDQASDTDGSVVSGQVSGPLVYFPF